MFTLEISKTYTDPAKRREYHRARYQANRAEILEAAARKKAIMKTLGEPEQTHTEARLTDADQVVDIRPILERDRRDNMEAIRLRLIWASSAGGDEGIVAKTAVAVIRFVEGDGKAWGTMSLRHLHRRLAIAEGLTSARFDVARETVARELFVPL